MWWSSSVFWGHKTPLNPSSPSPLPTSTSRGGPFGGVQAFASGWGGARFTAGGNLKPYGETKIGISSRWFNVTFLSPSWRSLNLQKGHLTIPKRSQWIARIILLSKKKGRIFSREVKPCLNFWGGGWLKFRGCAPDWNLEKNDPGTFVLERFIKKRPFFFKTVLEGCLWTYLVWKFSSKIQWKVRPFAGNNWLWEWSNPLKDPNFRGGWQKSGSEWPKKVCMQPKRNTSSWTVGLPGNFFSALLKRWLSHTHLVQKISSWWFQPLWKIWSSNWISSPIFGVKIKKSLSCHHPDLHLVDLSRKKVANPRRKIVHHSHRIHVWYICLHENHRFMPKM